MENKRILAVDDEEDILRILHKKLSADGYCVITATKGKEAIAKTKMFSPHLILMDIVLPDMDGSDVVKYIQEDVIFNIIPVIFLSGIVDEPEGGQPRPEIKVGQTHYPAIGKPISYQNLLSEVRKVVP